MQKSLKVIVFIIFCLCVFFVSCAPKVKTRVLMPAQVNLKGYKNVTVIDFAGKGFEGTNMARWLESELLKAKVGGEPYFRIITRSQLQKVLDEQKLQMTGLTDPATTKQIGKILGIDAIISGSIDGYDTEDGYYTEEKTRYVKSGDKTVPQTYYVDCTQRRAYVSFTVNFISVETGHIEVSEPVSYQTRAGACGGARNTQLSPRPEMLKQCAQGAIEQFVRKIIPHYEMQELTLKTKDDSGEERLLSSLSLSSKPAEQKKAIQKQTNEYIKAGCEYAKEGAWDNALQWFQKALDLSPESPAVNYNLGVIYEIKGELLKAQDYYQKASGIKPDKDYIRAVSHIEDRIKKREAVKEQLRR